MKKIIRTALLLFVGYSFINAQPAPFGALPSANHLAWHELEYYAFVHFSMNTFTDIEWGLGQEKTQSFNPTELDCRQWCRTFKNAGMKAVIITAKHHDGFCIWPSRYTDHSVKNSPWRNGKGDLLKELSEACREYGLKLGVYLSPWDRNHPLYGTPEYNQYFMQQLEEVLTGYGPIFEVWFDGANGEGPNGKRQDYDWNGFINVVRKHQPGAVIFSDAGDVRWVGNEQGFARETNWCTLNRKDYFPGTPRYSELTQGNKNGTDWAPAEVDVSIRPGWFYHPHEDNYVKSPEHLELIYYQSVGRNSNLLLNIPVDRRGLVHPKDSIALMGLKKRIDDTFQRNLALKQQAFASSTLNHSLAFDAANVTDGSRYTYWASTQENLTGSIEIKFDKPTRLNVISIGEYIPLGQRIESFALDVETSGGWRQVSGGTTIGNKRLLKFPAVQATSIRLRILSSMAPPTISELAAFYSPHDNHLLEPKESFDDRMDWWRGAHLGMFIHWGAYAVPGGVHNGKPTEGAGEWIMHTANIPIPFYEQYAKQFHPVRFDAQEWVRMAKNAGMKYIVITSKHHDGFCLWDSKVTDYDIMDTSPFKRDILKELADACERENIRLGFYYSIMDWHHPDAKAKGYEHQTNEKPDFARYRDNYLYPQLRELITRYQPAILWFDGEWIGEWTEAQGKDLYQFVRSLQPDIIINNRVGKGRNGMQGMNTDAYFVGDFGTPEQEILEQGGDGLDWESCMTMNDTWGYKKTDNNWKSAETLIYNLVDIVAKGGNYLLNVGPTAEGEIPDASQERLSEIGKWLEINGEAIYNRRPWDVYHEGDHVRYIQGNNGQVYGVLLQWPGKQINLRHIRPDNQSIITLLGYDKPLKWRWEENTGLWIDFPESLQTPSGRPCAYAWTLKIKGQKMLVSAMPQVIRDGKTIKNESVFTNTCKIALNAPESEATIYYTLDGRNPTAQSLKYQEPILVANNTTIKAVSISRDCIASPVSCIQLQKSRFNDIELAHSYSERYEAGGELALIDGRKGSENFLDGRWQGYEGQDLVALVDLGEMRTVKKIGLNCLENLNSWIFPPTYVEYQVSNDGITFYPVSQFHMNLPEGQRNPRIHRFEKAFSPVKCRYIKAIARNIGKCPSYHPGAGQKAWLFADEITVE